MLDKFRESRKIKRIVAYRHLPKYILNAKKRKQDQTVSKFNKRINKEANTGIKEERLPEKFRAVEKMEIEEKKYKRSKNQKPKKEDHEDHEDPELANNH